MNAKHQPATPLPWHVEKPRGMPEYHAGAFRIERRFPVTFGGRPVATPTWLLLRDEGVVGNFHSLREAKEKAALLHKLEAA